jgi:hypothetical protein
MGLYGPNSKVGRMSHRPTTNDNGDYQSYQRRYLELWVKLAHVQLLVIKLLA